MDWVESDCIRQAEQFAHLMEEYREPWRNVDNTFRIYMRRDGQLAMGNKIVQVDEDKNTLSVDGTEYDLTPDLPAFIMRKHPQISQWSSSDYRAYKSLSAQTKVRSHPNPEGTARPRATWKYKHMLRRKPGESIAEEETNTDDTDTVPNTLGKYVYNA